MVRGIGRALQKAVAREGLDVDLDAEGRSLANARRRQVYRYLCLRPCARIGDVGRDLSMSQATARWHARDLLENRYLQAEGTRVFPVGLIDPEDSALFAALASAGRAATLAPELLRRDETTLTVRFGAGPRRVLLEVPLDPYATAWMRHA